ncbi:MAG: hypothetical protein IJ225_04085 [Solobacterium sp.]|nr:hypothetical protein [Solobacterium sp.]
MERYSRITRMAITALGCLILGCGIGLCDHAGLGTDPFTVLLVGMQVQLGGTVGTLNLIVCLIMLVIAWLTDRKLISLISFLAVVCSSAGIDLMGMVFPGRSVALLPSILFLGAGELLYSFGTAVAIVPEAGMDAYNAFLTSVSQLLHCSYKAARWGVEAVFLIGGFLLGGIVGAGTVVSLILTAPLVEWIANHLRQWLISR